MGKRRTPQKGQRLSVSDFKLQERQMDFHDAYTDRQGTTYLNAFQSAVRSGYSESVAKSRSSTWTPPVGTTVESCGSLNPTAQAIFWTLHNRAEERHKIEAQERESTINAAVGARRVSREYIEGNLMRIVERCMGDDVKDSRGRDLASRIGAETWAKLVKDGKAVSDKDAVAIIGAAFRDYASKFRLFRPTQAKEAMRLLGIDIGMFITRLQKVPETPVDNLTPAQLVAERERLAGEWSKVEAELGKRKSSGNGKTKHDA